MISPNHNGERKIWRDTVWYREDGVTVIERHYAITPNNEVQADRFRGEMSISVGAKRPDGATMQHTIQVRFVIDGAATVEQAFARVEDVAKARKPEVTRKIVQEMNQKSLILPGKVPQLPTRLEL